MVSLRARAKPQIPQNFQCSRRRSPPKRVELDHMKSSLFITCTKVVKTSLSHFQVSKRNSLLKVRAPTKSQYQSFVCSAKVHEPKNASQTAYAEDPLCQMLCTEKNPCQNLMRRRKVRENPCAEHLYFTNCDKLSYINFAS